MQNKYTITAKPHATYDSVKDNKSGSEKDELIRKLLTAGVLASFRDEDATTLAQKQQEIVNDWSIVRATLSPEQRIIIGKLLSLNGVLLVGFSSLYPELKLYVIGTGEADDLYDKISDLVVWYIDKCHSAASYVYLTREEFIKRGFSGSEKYYKLKK